MINSQIDSAGKNRLLAMGIDKRISLLSVMLCCCVMAIANADDRPKSPIQPFSFTNTKPVPTPPPVIVSSADEQSSSATVPVLPSLKSGNQVAIQDEETTTPQYDYGSNQPAALRAEILSISAQPEEPPEVEQVTEAVYQVDDYHELGMAKQWVGIESDQLNLCAIYSHPTSGAVLLNGKEWPVKRGELVAYVSWWNGENIDLTRGEVSFLMGRELAQGAHVGHKIVIDDQVEIFLVGISNRLFVHPDNDTEALSLISSGSKLVVYAVGKDGEVMRDVYSLMGVQAATKIVNERCEVVIEESPANILFAMSDTEITTSLREELSKKTDQ